MEEPEPIKNKDSVVAGTTRRNVLIGLYRVKANDGTDVYAVAMCSFNSWAAQWKPIHCLCGITLDRADDIYEFSKRRMDHYDWYQGDLVLRES